MCENYYTYKLELECEVTNDYTFGGSKPLLHAFIMTLIWANLLAYIDT